MEQVDAYPAYAASALAANTFVRCVFAGTSGFKTRRTSFTTFANVSQLLSHFLGPRCMRRWVINGQPLFWRF